MEVLIIIVLIVALVVVINWRNSIGKNRTHPMSHNPNTATAPQIRLKVKEIIDQINHYIDQGMDSIYDPVKQEYKENPNFHTVERLKGVLRTWYSEGNRIGANWNKLPQSYQIWLMGYIQD